MNIRQMECFIILAEELNFRRAAERALITQPALSQQLRQIEEELQATLLFRTNRLVRLTPAGELFLGRAREIIGRMQETCNLVRQIEKGTSGNITIGATIPAIYILMADVISEMKKSLPNIEVSVHKMDTALQEEELRKNHIDIGLGHPPFEDKTLGSSNIAKIPFDVVMSKEKPLANKKNLTIKDLKDETFILFPRQMAPLQYDNIISICLQAGFSPKNIIEVSPAQAIIAFASTGSGIGFIASKQQQFPHPHVVYRPLQEEPKPYFTLGIVYRKEPANSVLMTFKKIVEEIGKHTC